MSARELFDTLLREGAAFRRHSGGVGLAIAMSPAVRDKYARQIDLHIDDLLAVVAEYDVELGRTICGSVDYRQGRDDDHHHR